MQISERAKSLSFFKLYQIKYSLNTALVLSSGQYSFKNGRVLKQSKMDLSVDLPFHFGPVHVGAAALCLVALGFTLLHSIGQFMAARRQLTHGLSNKKAIFRTLWCSFAGLLGILGLDVIGEFPRPSFIDESHYAAAVKGLFGLSILGFLATIGMALSRHASHQNH